MEVVMKDLIELPQAVKAGRQRDVGHRQRGVMDELLCEYHSPRLGDCDGR